MSYPDTMTAVEIREPGPPDVLVPTQRPVPQPGEGEVLIEIAVAGVNRPDVLQRQGNYAPPPGVTDIPGLEVAGHIVVVGPGVSEWHAGDAVCALVAGGGYAEYCAAPAGQCLPLPRGYSMVEGAVLPETFFTVWSNIFMGVGLKAGETFLVHGGAGGIGTTAIQLGKAFGAKVIATDSPEERCALCQDLGADRVVDYKQEDFVEVVRQEGGANVILDIVGGPNIERNMKAAAHDARIVQLAFALGAKVEVNLMPVMLKRLTYTGSTLRTRSPEFKARIAAELEAKVWPEIESGRIRVVTSRVFPLAEAAAAHALMESAAHTGKILLVPQS